MLAQTPGWLFPLSATQILTAPCSIKDKEGQVAQDYVAEDDTETQKAFQRYQFQESISNADIVYGA